MNTSGTSMRSKSVKEQVANILQNLNFPHCTINKTSSQKFILKNLSGIQTHFNFNVQNFAPLEMVAPKEKSELEKAKEELEIRAKKKLEEEAMGTGTTMADGKKKKKVGFANTSQHGFGASTSDASQMR